MNSENTGTVFERLSEVGIIPVVVLDRPEDAAPLAKVLLEGGLPAAEVTFRTDAAEESIRIMAETCPGILLGAGTVLTVEQAERAVRAGAEFLVSPGFDPELVSWCLERGVPVCPGIQTPSELMQAVKMGLGHVKFFPAENSGGLPMINAIGAAFPFVRFMPTGGINASNVTDYLRSERVFCCGGSWMVKSSLIGKKDFGLILELVKEAAEIVREVKK